MSTNENQTPQKESPKFFYVYILNCKDGGLYTGCTSNLRERFTDTKGLGTNHKRKTSCSIGLVLFLP
ncbi:MAG: GIY-YIG nuclease family protein [Lewinellaceae bacterium]|nr:GIY-YIG nuclease family protein [Lewinellaceae bacterium]